MKANRYAPTASKSTVEYQDLGEGFTVACSQVGKKTPLQAEFGGEREVKSILANAVRLGLLILRCFKMCCKSLCSSLVSMLGSDFTRSQIALKCVGGFVKFLDISIPLRYSSRSEFGTRRYDEKLGRGDRTNSRSEGDKPKLYSFLPNAYGLQLIASTIIFCVLFSNAKAQSPTNVGAAAKAKQQEIKPLEIGDTVPEEFWAIEHSFLVGDTVVKSSLNKFRGKLLLLDFWEPYCGPCLKNFPKIDSLNTQMRGTGNILLVNNKIWPLGTSTYITQKIGEYRSEKKLKLEMDKIIYDDKLNKYFEHRFIPYYVLIGYDGEVVVKGRLDIFDSIEKIIGAHIQTNKHLINKD